MKYKCYIMNGNSGKAWALDTHKERIEGETAAFTNRTTEYISNIQIFIQTSRKKKTIRASLSTSHSTKRITKRDHQLKVY
jgi:hypothetical protein